MFYSLEINGTTLNRINNFKQNLNWIMGTKKSK